MKKIRASGAISKLIGIGILVILVAAGAAGVYFFPGTSYLHNSGNIAASSITTLDTTTASLSPRISVEALSLNPSTSNLSSTVNVNSQSPIVRMDLYVNGTFIGSCNYTWSGSAVTGNYGMGLYTRSWSNGTYSMMFSIIPRYFPMMSGIRMMSEGSYLIKMVAYFKDGTNYTTSTTIYHNQFGNYGMMGNYYNNNNGNFSNFNMGNIMASMMARFYSVQTISIDELVGAMQNVPSNAQVFSNNNTIIFSGTQNVTILAFGMMPDKATNLTRMNPPSYATDDVFVIYGLIDPTLVIPNLARVNLIFANLDDDMDHNFVVTSLVPPYYNMPMQGMMFSNSTSWFNGGGMMGGGMMGGNSNSVFGTMMPFLSPANYDQGTSYYYVTSFNLRSYSGNYWYVCTYPGHAQGGMYGRIIIGS